MKKRTIRIPAAGSATRMRGIPKFLQATQASITSLLEQHPNFLVDLFDEISIRIIPDFSHLLKKVVNESLTFKLFELKTHTMMETIATLCEESVSESLSLIMPDTFFKLQRNFSISQ